MKKEFIEPEIEVIDFEVEEIIADGPTFDSEGWSEGWN